MLLVGKVIVVCLSVAGFQGAATARLDGSCTTPNGESAKCKSIYDCKLLLDAVQTSDEQQRRFLRQSQCGYDRYPLVCCGTLNNFGPSSTRRLSNGATDRSAIDSGEVTSNANIPDRTACGYQVNNRIVGGRETDLDEFPWIALLEYSHGGNITKLACGGSIISKRYILTAAHCVKGAILRSLGPLVNVRLGEWDTRQGVDCVKTAGISICNKSPENFGVEEIISHSEYDPNSLHKYHDIALIRVNRDIPYSAFIRPICLPLPGEKSEPGENLTVAGWGQTENASSSPVKLKVEVPIAETSYCFSKFRSAKIQLKNSQICAGGEKGKDSCAGDSGGPLMNTVKTDSSQWYVEGVVSFGGICGIEGWPAVYTRVSDYLNWIYSKVRQ